MNKSKIQHIAKLASLLVILLVIVWAVIRCSAAPSPQKSNTPTSSTSEQKQFITMISNATDISNTAIMTDRKKLLALAKQPHDKLSSGEQNWLTQLAQRYGVSSPNFSQDASWQTLISRVDVLPNSLVIAQAINESAWGRSRFAKDANNYFGIWCYSKGCGLVPKQRSAGATHEVQKFTSVQDSVNNYLANINSHNAYKDLRDVRAQLRKNGKKITGLDLAQGLSKYSERGGAYVVSISKLINGRNLSTYDNATYLKGS